MHLTRRALAASALALASLTAATGCTYTNAGLVASYAPGAAASASLGTVHVAGLFVATDDKGLASLVARIVNSGTQEVTVQITGTGDSSSLSGTFDVPASSTYDVGPAGKQKVTSSSWSVPAGQVVTMTVSTDGSSQQLAVPVLDGTLEQYAQYVPTPTPTSTPTPQVTGSPSATGTRTGSPSASGSSARSATGAPSGASSETASGTPTQG